MQSRRGTGPDHPVTVASRRVIIAGLPALVALTAPFALAGFSPAAGVFFWALGGAAWAALATLAARLAGSKVQFVGAFVVLAGLALLLMFVPPFEWRHLYGLGLGAHAGSLLGIILVSGRVNRLPDV